MFRRLPLLVMPLLVATLTGQAGEPKFQPTEMEKKLLELTNAERKMEKLAPLKFNPILMKLARDHSKNMAKQGKMEHVLDDKSPRDRIKAARYDYRIFGENIAYEEGDIQPAEVMKGWMASKKHKENILEKDFTELGVSLSTNDKGETYYTQVFGRPKR